MSRRVLVVVPNWLGDAVMALPAIADLRRAMPEATVDLAARPSVAPLATLVPGVGATVPLGSRRERVDRVRAGRYDAALLLPNSFQSAWVVWKAGVPERWGFRRDLRAPLLTRAIVPPVRVHQAAYYQTLTTALGFSPGPLEPRLTLTPDARERGDALLSEAGWTDGHAPLIAMAPGAAYGGAKRWPAPAYAELLDALAGDGVRTVLVGARGDMPASAEVRATARTGAGAIDLTGRTDLPALAGVLARCRALVTNDSGAMHLAAALGTDVVALFGPTNESETRPLGPVRARVLHTGVWCRPCMLRECPLTHRCMTGIAPAVVAQEARASL
ncbi:MAG: lipopolysaccharide heptosyltransferase II [Vicinamibacterales bacterium]